MSNFQLAAVGRSFDDTVTIATAKDDCVLAKQIRSDGTIIDYDRAYLFDLDERQVSSLTDIAGLLHELAPAWNRAVVRGAIANSALSLNVRRLLHKDLKTGDEATLLAVPHYWVALDIDNLPLPPTIPAADLARCAEVAIRLLPPEFSRARTLVQATASHGIKPGARLRLWNWLSRPLGRDELTAWFRNHQMVDKAVFHDSQLTYTATPIFCARFDHLPQRLVQLPGAEVVQVPPVEMLRPVCKPKSLSVPHLSNVRDVQGYGQAALIRAAQRILESVEGERHNTIINVCARLLPLLHLGILLEPVARNVIWAAVDAAAWPNPANTRDAIDWVFSRPPEPLFEDVRDA